MYCTSIASSTASTALPRWQVDTHQQHTCNRFSSGSLRTNLLRVIRAKCNVRSAAYGSEIKNSIEIRTGKVAGAQSVLPVLKSLIIVEGPPVNGLFDIFLRQNRWLFARFH